MNEVERELEQAYGSLQAGHSPQRLKRIQTISDDSAAIQIGDDQMDKISQKLHLDFKKFKSMNKESQKDVEQVILDYKMQLTQDANNNSRTFSSGPRSKLFYGSADRGASNLSPGKQLSNQSPLHPSGLSKGSQKESKDEEFLKKMEQDKFRQEVYKRIFKVLLKDYDED